MPFQSAASSPRPVSAIQDSTVPLPTLCLLVSSTPMASRARICLQMGPAFSQNVADQTPSPALLTSSETQHV